MSETKGVSERSGSVAGFTGGFSTPEGWRFRVAVGPLDEAGAVLVEAEDDQGLVSADTWLLSDGSRVLNSEGVPSFEATPMGSSGRMQDALQLFVVRMNDVWPCVLAHGVDAGSPHVARFEKSLRHLSAEASLFVQRERGVSV